MENLNLIKVLFAENDAQFSSRIATDLGFSKEPQFDVKCVSGTEAGMQLLNNEKFDVILLDLQEKNGASLPSLRRFQSLALDTPIIILSEKEDEKLAAEALQSGAYDFLNKKRINSGVVSRVLSYSVWRKRLEQKRQQANHSYRSMFQNASLAMCILDDQGMIRDANVLAQKKLGLPIEQLRLKKVTEFLKDFVSIAPNISWQQSLHGRKVAFPESGAAAQSFYLQLINYEDSDFQGVSFLLIFEPERSMPPEVKPSALSPDFPMELKRQAHTVIDLDRKLGFVDELKSEFLSAVAHELKTPISAIQGYFQLLYRDLEGNITRNQSELLALIKGSLESLHQRSLELIQLSELESGQKSSPISLLDISNYVKESFTMFEGAARVKNIATNLHIENPLKKIWCNPKQIKTILNNLLSNAVKYTPHGGSIQLSVANQGPGVSIKVLDTGIGIESKRKPKIFDPFQSSEEHGRMAAADSSGLGLSLVKRMVEASRGTIEFKSEIGKGSEFKVFLPEDRRNAPHK